MRNFLRQITLFTGNRFVPVFIQFKIFPILINFILLDMQNINMNQKVKTVQKCTLREVSLLLLSLQPSLHLHSLWVTNFITFCIISLVLLFAKLYKYVHVFLFCLLFYKKKPQHTMYILLHFLFKTCSGNYSLSVYKDFPIFFFTSFQYFRVYIYHSVFNQQSSFLFILKLKLSQIEPVKAIFYLYI